jgi:hypothetical protein
MLKHTAENICFEVIDNVQHFMAAPRSDSQIFRAKFSGVLSESGLLFWVFLS